MNEAFGAGLREAPHEDGNEFLGFLDVVLSDQRQEVLLERFQLGLHRLIEQRALAAFAKLFERDDLDRHKDADCSTEFLVCQ